MSPPSSSAAPSEANEVPGPAPPSNAESGTTPAGEAGPTQAPAAAQASPPQISCEVRELPKTIARPKSGVVELGPPRSYNGVPAGAPGGGPEVLAANPARLNPSKRLPKTVLDHALFTGTELSPAALYGVEPGKILRTRVRFCVDGNGATFNVETKRSSGIDRLDRALLERVERWRFRPFPDGDQTMMPCVTVEIAAKQPTPPNGPA